MVAQAKPRLGEIGITRLPDPSAHARRQREAIGSLVLPANAELLYVNSIAGNLVVLRRLDGTVIDEEIVALALAPLQVGDRVVRLPLPGSGTRDARGSYVAIGPVRPTRAAPTVTVGAAAGGGATATVSGTDEFCRVTLNVGTSPATGTLFTLTWANARRSAAYGIWCSGRNVAGRTVVAGGIAQSAADTGNCPVAVAVAPPASTQVLLNVLMRDA